MANWTDVKGYEGLYLISDNGDVISLPREVVRGKIKAHRKSRLLKPHLRGRGNQKYPSVTLTKNNKSVAYSIHRLVAIAFIPNPYDLPEVNHKDENTLNYKASNLEWCDRQYNIDYSKSKRIEQYLNGEKIAEYKSISFAEKLTGISRKAINNALKGWSCSAGGYDWKYCKLKGD